MGAEETFKEYQYHLSAVDSEFRRASQRFAGRMQCRKGCSMCCSQMFSISIIEAAYISRAVKAMPRIERERLQATARRYIASAGKLTAGVERDEPEESITPRPGVRLTCPALKADACTIYEARPIICRKWGIPLFNPRKPLELQACDLNFKPGEEVDVEDLIEPQVALLEEWVELKGRAGRRHSPPQLTATVAEAIASNFEEILITKERGMDGTESA